MTQWQELLALFLSKEGKEVCISEIADTKPRGLGIKQYSSRIKDLRKMGWNIICVRDGYFVLRGKQEQVQERATTIRELKAELEDLRKVWEISPGSARKKIENQGMKIREQLEVMEALI